MAPEQLRLRCGCPTVHEAFYDPSAATSITGAVVDAIAAAADVNPIDLPPLNDSVDPDALEGLFDDRSGGAETKVIFGFAVDGWNVFVRSDGHIRVCDPSKQPNDSPGSVGNHHPN